LAAVLEVESEEAWLPAAAGWFRGAQTQRKTKESLDPSQQAQRAAVLASQQSVLVVQRRFQMTVYLGLWDHQVLAVASQQSAGSGRSVRVAVSRFR
jgi:hypothetical protein